MANIKKNGNRAYIQMKLKKSVSAFRLHDWSTLRKCFDIRVFAGDEKEGEEITIASSSTISLMYKMIKS